MTSEVLCGDNIELMRAYQDNFFDAIATDPPYGISFMSKEWDTFDSAYLKEKQLNLFD